MTSADLESYKMTVPGNCPFACGSTASVVVPDASEPASASADYFSNPNGFGEQFDAVPAADGANMIQRGQINYLGKMAGLVPFLWKVGGDYWTFDPDVATDEANSAYGIGGYPEGAILTLIESGCYLKVISLKDNNKVDFTGNSTTPKYSDIINGTVDGVNWQYLYLDPQDLIDQDVLVTVPEMNVPFSNVGILGCFKAKNNGALVVNGSVTITDLTEKSETSGGSLTNGVTTTMYFALIVSAGQAKLADLGNWSPTASGLPQSPNGTVIYSAGTIAESQLMMVEKGKWYGIGFSAVTCNITNSSSSSSMQIKIVTD